MMTWAMKRKMLYLGGALAVILFLVTIPSFYVFYTPPSCVDGKQNQSEVGIDCGGPCSILCKSQALDPIVLWQRVFRVVPGVYSAVAYVENPNLDSGSARVPYSFKLYDNKNTLITERTGETFIPPKKIFPIFEGTITSKDIVPTKTTFEFTKNPVWTSVKKALPEITVSRQIISGETTRPRITGVLETNSIVPLKNIEVDALVFDGVGNAVAVSKTIVDRLEKNVPQNVVFTWPEPFPEYTKACQKPIDVALLVDRSGSMDDKKVPPEPLTSVKNAATSFVKGLRPSDQVSVISFANEASQPLDLALTSGFSQAENALSNITVSPDGTQNTNVGDAFMKAVEALSASVNKAESNQAIVLLTDGIANAPTKTDDKNYPENYALLEAKEAKDKAIEIFSIGLGGTIHDDFLKQISSGADHYFSAPTAKDLETIYKKIGSALCKEAPSVIQIIPKLYPGINF